MSRPIRVLLIEDSDSDAALLMMELRKGGFKPVCERAETAETMAAALDQGPWDVVIADYVLPKFSGPAALRLLQARGLDLPFIIVSGHIDEETAVASMKAGAHDYVMKDRLTRLVPAIEREMEEAKVRRARKLTEERFAREQAFRQTIENSIPSGIAAIDCDGVQTYVNPAFCDMVGWSEQELLGKKPPYPFCAPEDFDAIQAAFRQTAEGQAQANGYELRFLHRSGRRFDALILVNPLHDQHGSVSGWLASVTDITERKQAERRLRVQYEVARVLSEAISLRAATPEVLRIIGESMGWDAGALWRVEASGTELRCVELWHAPSLPASGFETANRRIILSVGDGLPGRILASGQPFWSADLAAEMRVPRLEAMRKEGFLAVCGFPIRFGEEVLGVIEFFSHDVRPSEEALLHWMISIGRQLGQFMQRETAQEALRRAHDQLEQRVRERTAELISANAQLELAMRERQRLEHELLEITEKERRRIGLDLHDDLGQKLAGVALMMKGLEVGLAKKRLPEAGDARKISTLISQTVDHAGGLARDLALGELQEDDLPTALRDLAANVKGLFAISCRFQTEGRIPALDRHAITQFYKITQEAVTNAVKHGKAHQVGIRLVHRSHKLVLTIRNDGLPFPSMIDKSKGMGLRIMTYRANLIGATLDIKPGRQGGTVVTCTLPANAKLQRDGHANKNSNGKAHKPIPAGADVRRL